MQIRFESQKREAEEHAAKMELLHLKQEDQKQRNERLSRPKSAVATVPVTELNPASATA